jgi:hypothetical protein
MDFQLHVNHVACLCHHQPGDEGIIIIVVIVIVVVVVVVVSFLWFHPNIEKMETFFLL